MKEAKKEVLNKGGFKAILHNNINDGKKINWSILEIKHYSYTSEEKFVQFELFADNQLKLELYWRNNYDPMLFEIESIQKLFRNTSILKLKCYQDLNNKSVKSITDDIIKWNNKIVERCNFKTLKIKYGPDSGNTRCLKPDYIINWNDLIQKFLLLSNNKNKTLMLYGLEFKSYAEFEVIINKSENYDLYLKNWEYLMSNYDNDDNIEIKSNYNLISRKITIASSELDESDIYKICNYLKNYGYSLFNIKFLDTQTKWAFVYWDILNLESKRREFAEGIQNALLTLKTNNKTKNIEIKDNENFDFCWIQLILDASNSEANQNWKERFLEKYKSLRFSSGYLDSINFHYDKELFEETHRPICIDDYALKVENLILSPSNLLIVLNLATVVGELKFKNWTFIIDKNIKIVNKL